MRVVAPQEARSHHRFGGEDELVVGGHHALGRAGGAAGVEDGGQLVALLLLEALLQLARHPRLVLLAPRDELREGQPPVAVALAFEQHAAAHRGQLRAHLAQLA